MKFWDEADRAPGSACGGTDATVHLRTDFDSQQHHIHANQATKKINMCLEFCARSLERGRVGKAFHSLPLCRLSQDVDTEMAVSAQTSSGTVKVKAGSFCVVRTKASKFSRKISSENLVSDLAFVHGK